MRRMSVLVVLVAVSLCVTAAPGHAQRDPFVPAIDEDQSGQTGSAETPPAPAEPAPGSASELADTGSDPVSWVALAYALVALGGGLVLFVRIARRPGR